MRRRSVLGVLLGICAVSACGGTQREPASAPSQTEAAPPPDRDAEEAEPAAMSPGGVPASEPAAEESGPSSDRARATSGADDGLHEDLLASERELGAALALSTPNCGMARALRDQICDLAARICELGGDGEVRDRCGQAQDSCKRAKTRVGLSCGE